MASLVQSAHATTAATPVTVTFTNPVTANNLIVLVCWNGVGVTCTSTGFTADITSNAQSQILYKVAAGGENNISVAATGSNLEVVALEFSGTLTSGVTDGAQATSGAAGASPYALTALTTANANDVIVAVAGASGAVTGPGWTNSFIDASFASTHLMVSYKFVTATGSYGTSASYTSGSDFFQGAIAAFGLQPVALPPRVKSNVAVQRASTW